MTGIKGGVLGEKQEVKNGLRNFHRERGSRICDVKGMVLGSSVPPRDEQVLVAGGRT